MTEILSVCGIYDCRTCGYRASGRCLGCLPGNAAVNTEQGETCRVYECVNGKNIASCSECREPSCTLKRVAELICPLRSRLEKERWWAGKLSRAMGARGSADKPQRTDPSEKVVNRLRWYLTALDSFAAESRESVPSWQLAERVGVSSALIRKDLSRFGDFGTPSYGYRIEFLRERLRSILCLGKQRELIWIGAGALRLNPHAQDRLQGHNCRLRAVFDDESEAGTRIGSLRVRPISALSEELAGRNISAAVLAVYGHKAHDIAQTLADLGVSAILNLSGELIVMPPHIRVINLDVIGELLELCYYC